MYLCIVVCECVRGGRLEAKINGVVFGCIPEEHCHQSRASCRCPLYLCVSTYAYAWASVCLRQERLRAQNHFLIISSQFLHFFSVCVCVCPSVYPHCIREACCIFSSILVSPSVYFPQQEKVRHFKLMYTKKILILKLPIFYCQFLRHTVIETSVFKGHKATLLLL